MKKLILFSLLVSALSGMAQTDEPSWQDGLKQFREVDRDVGYKNTGEFIAFIDRAEGVVQADKSALARFADNPAGFLDTSGIGLTILLILLGGLLLNLTPCVLPMIPVNLAIIGAGAQSESRAKGFALGGMYGLGIASVYGVLGLIAVLGGKNFGTLNASPWFNFGIAAIFLVLALSMFGLLHIDFSRFQRGGRSQLKSRFVAAFVMGGIAALLAGACVAPVVIAVLLLSGNLYAHGVTVGLALPFVLGLGMSLPWPFAGAGLSFLPKPGAWMEWVKRVFGVLILLFALYYGLLGSRILKMRMAPSGREEHSVLCDGKSTCFSDALNEAYLLNQPVFIDFWADWCKNCHAMDATFKDPAILERMARYKLIKFDATNNNESPAKEILDHFGVLGLPTYVILEPVK